MAKDSGLVKGDVAEHFCSATSLLAVYLVARVSVTVDV
jgi:hypothetical protein